MVGGVGLAIAVVATGALVLGDRLGADGEIASRQREVRERGAMVMPFDLDETRHVFSPTSDGGTQQVVADDATDGEQIALIRRHLREEAAAFERGDFGDPAAIHGHEMPGVAVLEANAGKLTIVYRDLPDGGEVTYRSSDASIVRALHEWFEAQLADHGDDAHRG